MLPRIVMLLVLLMFPVIACGADAAWKVFEVKGKVSVTSDSGTKVLSNEKSLLENLRKGSRIKVEAGGKLVVVSLKARQAFEVGEGSEAVVDEDQIRAVKGSVTVKKGLSLPKGSDGKMGGIVMRGAGNTRSCLKALAPVNSAIIDLAPELRWENNCDGLKQVTITILADERIVHTAESGSAAYNVPAGILQAGNRYMWLIDGGANFDMASGVFTVLSETDRSETLARMAEFKASKNDDVASMIAYIYFLDGKGLSELTRTESDKLRKRFPDAEGLKDLP